MEHERKTEWRTTAKTHPRRVTLYENDDGVRLLRDIARRRGCTVATAMRQLVREEANRIGLERASSPPTESAPLVPDTARPTPRLASVLGKYAWVPTSSEEFSRRKQEEIAREDGEP